MKFLQEFEVLDLGIDIQLADDGEFFQQLAMGVRHPLPGDHQPQHRGGRNRQQPHGRHSPPADKREPGLISETVLHLFELQRGHGFFGE